MVQVKQADIVVWQIGGEIVEQPILLKAWNGSGTIEIMQNGESINLDRAFIADFIKALRLADKLLQ